MGSADGLSLCKGGVLDQAGEQHSSVVSDLVPTLAPLDDGQLICKPNLKSFPLQLTFCHGAY